MDFTFEESASYCVELSVFLAHFRPVSELFFNCLEPCPLNGYQCVSTSLSRCFLHYTTHPLFAIHSWHSWDNRSSCNLHISAFYTKHFERRLNKIDTSTCHYNGPLNGHYIAHLLVQYSKHSSIEVFKFQCNPRLSVIHVRPTQKWMTSKWEVCRTKCLAFRYIQYRIQCSGFTAEWHAVCNIVCSWHALCLTRSTFVHLHPQPAVSHSSHSEMLQKCTTNPRDVIYRQPTHLQHPANGPPEPFCLLVFYILNISFTESSLLCAEKCEKLESQCL